MNLHFLGDTIDVLGKLMVAYTAIRVHQRFRKEHSVNDKVFIEMRREQLVGILGMAFIAAGYLIRNFI